MRQGDVMRRNRRAGPLVQVRSAFTGFRFAPEVILLAVRWYLRYGLSYRFWRRSSPSAVSTWTACRCSGGCSGSRRC